MKIKYEFATETVEIDVEEQWANIVLDLDRQEFNVEHKETRRHCSLEAYNLDDSLLPSDEDLVGDVIRNQENERLYRAIGMLTPEQQDLVKAIFFEGVSVSDYAASHGVSQPAISQKKETAIKKLKKLLK